ncbi:MAG: hypothetical protein Q9228_004830 [Teloschistes exilis]
MDRYPRDPRSGRHPMDYAYGDPRSQYPHPMDDDDSDIEGLISDLHSNPFADLVDHDGRGHSRFAPHMGGHRDPFQNPRRGRGARGAHPMDPRNRHPGADCAGSHRDPHGHPGDIVTRGRHGGMPRGRGGRTRGRGGRPRGPDPRAGFGDHRLPDHPSRWSDSDSDSIDLDLMDDMARGGRHPFEDSDSDHFDPIQDIIDAEREDYEEEMALREEMAMYENDYPMGPPPGRRRRGPRMGPGGMMGGRRTRGPREWI